MNLSQIKTKNNSKNVRNIFTILIFSASAILIITKQNLLKNAIEMSLKICISTIIPAVFPFMILSDFLICNFFFDKGSRLSRIFSKIFFINPIGLLPFLIGNICGFPLGAQIATRLYEEKSISRDEYERLLPLCSNPSVAFVISGVGGGMRGSLKEGAILFIAILISTVISGIVWRKSNSATDFQQFFTHKMFSLATSIKAAALSAIYVSSYIVFFSIIIAIFESMKMPELIRLAFASFLEIGNASSLITRANIGLLSMPLTAFSLAFSGISVYMQVLCFSSVDAKNEYYIKIKLTEGIIAFIITFVMSLLLL